MLPEGDTIHVFSNPSPGVLIGADWTRDEIVKHLRSNQVQLSGEHATSMGHGMVIGSKYGDYLFIETKKGD
jgi:hypothetical protein